MKHPALRHNAAADTIRVYLFPYTLPDGADGHLYLICSPKREQELEKAIAEGKIPAFAQVIACGKGEPDERMRFNIERYYGQIYGQPIAA